MGRALAFVLALTVAASGSGLPMCANLLARAVEACTMHQHERGSHDGHGGQVVPGHGMDDACHSGDGDVGCATGGSCSTGGAAAPRTAEAMLATSTPVHAVTPTIEAAHLSFLSAPPPPPPQA